MERELDALCFILLRRKNSFFPGLPPSLKHVVFHNQYVTKSVVNN